MLNFSTDITSNPFLSTAKEWLVTNGLGGYASGTIANALTRRYHGYLVAALEPPLGRTVLLSKLDETVMYNHHHYPLYTNQWQHGQGPFEPPGFHYLEHFHLEGTTPVWTYACADARLEKRLWMQRGENTTYIRYDLRQGNLPLTLSIKVLANYKDFHHNIHAGDWQMQVESIPLGLKILAFAGAKPFYVLSDKAEIRPAHDWYYAYFLAREADRGLDAVGDQLCVGQFEVTLLAGESMTIVASTDPQAGLESMYAYTEQQAHERELLRQSNLSQASAEIQHLVLAADQFIVQRNLPNGELGQSIIAGYPWFGDWGRDTMISLPGLTLATRRPDIAADILRTFAQYVDQGMLPNRFPDSGTAPEYNTVDATLWYIEAIRAYYAATQDINLLRQIYPILQQIIEWHQRGTRYRIRMDAADGLLYAGEAGVQLTWMDAKVGDWVLTPRIGKAIEINALWYNALRAMSDFSQIVAEPSDLYDTLAEQVQAGFAHFWGDDLGYCYDVIDGPPDASSTGDRLGYDDSLRPNQLFAVSLHHSPLSSPQQKAIVDVCANYLLTSMGLRTLAPYHPDYQEQFRGGPQERDAAYHQGTVWPWLIGPFIEAHWRVYQDSKAALTYLQPLLQHLPDHGVGSISEVAEGQAPHRPKAGIAQAWSVAEVLRVWRKLEIGS